MAIYLVCPQCRLEYSVKKSRCPKCGLAVKQDKTFRISVSYHGKRIRQTVVGTNLQGAKEIEAKIKSELVSGEYYDRRADIHIEFEKFVREKYLPYAQSKKSYAQEKSSLKIWVIPVIGKKTMDSISPFDLEKIKKNMLDADKAPRTIEYVLAIVRQVFNKAIDWGMCTILNPTSKVKSPKKDNKRRRFLTKEEAEKLLSELKKRSIKLYEMAYLSLYTGMRFGEVANLTWQDIDFKNNLIIIKDTKNNTSRFAYITKNIKNLLLAKYNREKPENLNKLLFKKTIDNKLVSVSNMFSKVVNQLGLNNGITDPRDKVVFHTLRHTFASWLAIEGTPIYTIKELMGHKSLSMTERYSHLSSDSKKEAVEKLSGLYSFSTL